MQGSPLTVTNKATAQSSMAVPSKQAGHGGVTSSSTSSSAAGHGGRTITVTSTMAGGSGERVGKPSAEGGRGSERASEAGTGGGKRWSLEEFDIGKPLGRGNILLCFSFADL